MTSTEQSALVAQLRGGGSVFAEEELAVLTESAQDQVALQELVDRRCAGEPIELLVGWAEFAGLRIQVTPGVFIPRVRTEFLATTARDLVIAAPAPVRFLDFACGAGPIAAVVRKDVPAAEVVAADIDPQAVACAQQNLPGVRVTQVSSLQQVGAAAGAFSVIAANLPYVPSDQVALMPWEAREYEPLHTLDGGADGLEPLRRIAPELAQMLVPGGHFLTETSQRQANTACSVLQAAGLIPEVLQRAELGATVVRASSTG